MHAFAAAFANAFDADIDAAALPSALPRPSLVPSMLRRPSLVPSALTLTLRADLSAGARLHCRPCAVMTLPTFMTGDLKRRKLRGRRKRGRGGGCPHLPPPPPPTKKKVSIRIVYPSETCPLGPISWQNLRTGCAQVLLEDGPQRAGLRGVNDPYTNQFICRGGGGRWGQPPPRPLLRRPLVAPFD